MATGHGKEQALDLEFSAEQEVEQVAVDRPHVVVMGAGASIAACPEGDASGIQLPSMNDLVEKVGLTDIFNPGSNFEEQFTELFSSGDSEKIKTVEQRIHEYFYQMRLPDRPTLYDHLVLALRDSDIIASFNWDPLLLHAYTRHRRANLSRPRVAFLHGNVAAGYCEKDRVAGLVTETCRHCGNRLTPSPLLFPITKKDYAKNVFIANEWKLFKWGLANAFMLTVFGYRGPRTDQEAIEAMKEGWGKVDDRNLEQTAFIIRKGGDRRAIRQHWDAFVHSHHYEVYEDFYDSWIANHPRRTGEAWWNQFLEAKFIEANPIPKDAGFDELYAWFSKYRGPEEKYKAQRQSKPSAPAPSDSGRASAD